MSNYPPGADNDPRAPYNEPLTKIITVEVSAELGTFVDVDVPLDEEGYPETDCLNEAVRIAIKDKYNIDNVDTVLNEINIWDWR